jgi:L-asparaginase
MSHVLILGTGGTIAGTACDPARSWAYQAAQLSVEQLVAAVPELAGQPLLTRQVAQVDSKDMGWRTWQALGQAIDLALADDDVGAIVVTHGTDTLEETACLLHALHDGRKPIVLTAAMRPATAPDADGPANLAQAVRVAREAAQRGQGGVVACLAGRTWSARDVRKAHSHAIDAFDGGGASALAEGEAWPQPEARGWQLLQGARPPRVELVTSHADADGWWVDAVLAHASAQGGADDALRGLVVACTGHGTVHEGLEAALERASAAGVVVWRSSRVARGGVLSREGDVWPAAGAWTPAQARVRLQLDLLSARP